jgi:hypothetical protein
MHCSMGFVQFPRKIQVNDAVATKILEADFGHAAHNDARGCGHTVDHMGLRVACLCPVQQFIRDNP